MRTKTNKSEGPRFKGPWAKYRPKSHVTPARLTTNGKAVLDRLALSLGLSRSDVIEEALLALATHRGENKTR